MCILLQIKYIFYSKVLYMYTFCDFCFYIRQKIYEYFQQNSQIVRHSYNTQYQAEYYFSYTRTREYNPFSNH